MRESLMGIKQTAATQYELQFDHQAILRWFLDWAHYGTMTTITVQGKRFYWIRWQTVIDELPALSVKSKDSIRRRLEHMVETGVLEYYFDKKGGSRTYYRPNPQAIRDLLWTDEDKSEGSGKNARGGMAEPPEGVGQNCSTDCAVKDCDTKDREEAASDRRERWELVADNPGTWSTSFDQQDLEYIDQVISFHAQRFNVCEAKKTNSLIKRLAKRSLEYADNGRNVVFEVIKKAKELSTQKELYNQCSSLQTLLSEKMFENVRQTKLKKEYT